MSPRIECLRQDAAVANSSARWSSPIRAQSVDQPGGERIAAADPIDDVRDLVVPAGEEVRPVVQHGAPAVVVGAVTFAERDHLSLEIRKCLEHASRQVRGICPCSSVPAFTSTLDIDPERLLAVLFVRDADRAPAQTSSRITSGAFLPYFQRFFR